MTTIRPETVRMKTALSSASEWSQHGHVICVVTAT